MSVHKLTAGSGYDYLTRQVAALDATEKGHTGLASYYTERGESPGVWIGSGMDGIDGLAAGDPVTAEQMRALFGCGLHPLAELRQQQLEGPDLTDQDFQNVARLGAPFRIVDNDLRPFRVEVAKRIAALNTAIGWPADASIAAADRARVRTQVAREFFRAEHGREPVDARELTGQIAKDSRPRTQTVAGYDLTFSPVKSVSTLWAVADPAVAAVIEQAHQAAVKDALRFIEKHALFTRTGPQGIRQVNVRGLVATAFTHRDSRAGDPDLHTHVAVANKVQTLDGRWLSIDGRVLFKANVAASETYNTALEQHLRDSLGVRFAERPGTDPAKRPIREIVGVDPRLNQRWSTRRAHINTRRGELAIQFQQDHGRPPTPVEALHLAQQATLETRDAKHEPRSLTEQRATWLNEAAAVLGGRGAVAAMVQTALTPAAETATIADARWVAQTADHILAVMEDEPLHLADVACPRRSATAGPHRGRARRAGSVRWWTCWSMRCWIAGLLPWPHRLTTSRNRMRCGGSTGRRSTPSPAPTCTPRSGSSTPSSASLPPRDAATGQPSTSRRWIWLCWRWRRTALPWMPGRLRWSGRCAPRVPGCSSRSPRPAPGRPPPCVPSPWPGPKTAARCSASPRPRPQPLFLASRPASAPTPSPNSPGPCSTASLPDWAAAVGPSTLVIIDEAGMADTLTLDAAVQFAIDRGASVRLVGDDQQLAAIGAGGVLRDITHTHGALHLTELHRFTNPAEAAASLALREGKPTALTFYLDHDRIHVGDIAKTTEDAFTAWVSTDQPDWTPSCSPPPASLSPNSTVAPVIIASTGHARACGGASGRRQSGECRRCDHHPQQRPPTPTHRHRLGQERRPVDHHPHRPAR